MIDQYQLRALGEKLKQDSSEVVQDINSRGREHLQYLDGLAMMLQEFLAVVDQQRQKFAVYGERPVEHLNARRATAQIGQGGKE
jgi:hypothetical protein